VCARKAISPSPLKSQTYFDLYIGSSATEKVALAWPGGLGSSRTVIRAFSFRQSADDPDCHLSISFVTRRLRLCPASQGFSQNIWAVTLLLFTPL